MYLAKGEIGMGGSERTEIISHHIPEVKIRVHVFDVQFLVIVWSTRGRDLDIDC